jgi:hypothetical protein
MRPPMPEIEEVAGLAKSGELLLGHDGPSVVDVAPRRRKILAHLRLLEFLAEIRMRT